MSTSAPARRGALRAVMSLEPFARHPGRTLAAIGLLFTIAYLAAFLVFPRGRVIDGDAIQYYAYLRSIVFDRDVDFTNDYELLYGPLENGAGNIWLTSRSAVGRPTNLMSIGPALLWSPFFLLACAAAALFGPFGGAIPLDGVAPIFPLSVGVAGIVYATLGAYLCSRAAQLLFDGEAGFWAALVAWLASPAIYYSLVSPSYSHATSLFACALFCFVWLRSRDRVTLGRHAWLGALAGLAALVRWQDVVWLLLPTADLAAATMNGKLTKSAAALRAGTMGAAAFLMLTPQLVAWYGIYGEPLLMPQGQGFMRWTSPALLSVLFSARHGLFTWTPAVLLAVVGLAVLAKRDVSIGGPALVVFLLGVYINASVVDWWAGEAFGARRFVSYTVLFALGLSAIFSLDFWKKRPIFRRWFAAGVVAYNVLFLLQYQLFMRGYHDLAPYPTTMRQILVDRLMLPWVVLREWGGF
jgi:hypothetical protein